MTTCTPECEAEMVVLVEALERTGKWKRLSQPDGYLMCAVCCTGMRCECGPNEHIPRESCPNCLGESGSLFADTSSAALLAQGEGAGIETLREMAHAFYEGGRPITKEQLDAFCAVGPSDTSPAAPLAQGERLRELTEAAASVVEGEHLSRELGACEVHNAVDLCWWDKRIANLRAALGEEKE